MGAPLGSSEAPSTHFSQSSIPGNKNGRVEDRVVAKEKVPKATKAKISTASPKATQLLQLCEKGMKLGDYEEPDVGGNPERTAKKKYGRFRRWLQEVEPWIFLFNKSSWHILVIVSLEPGKAFTGGRLPSVSTSGAANLTMTLYEQHARCQDLPPHTLEPVEVSYITRYVYVDLYRGTDAKRPFTGCRVPLGGVMKVDGGSVRVFDRKGREIIL